MPIARADDRLIRVLIVDDSVVVRRLVTTALSTAPEITVAGAAASARIGLQKIEQLMPDVVTLDLEMPDQGGMECLVEIRRRWPTLPVIVFSGITDGSAVLGVQALARGATDVVPKPAGLADAEAAVARIREDLVPRILAVGSVHEHGQGVAAMEGRTARRAGEPAITLFGTTGAGGRSLVAPRSPVDVLAIGASTGGPNALTTLLAELPADLAVPVLITQHMPPTFTRQLAERLDALSRLTVREAHDGARLTPGTVWVAPGDHHLGLRRAGEQVTVRLNQGAHEHSCRPAVDAMYRAVHAAYGGRVLAVLLTGMGRDGTSGARLLRAAGATILAQDEASSVVWGMPGSVVQAGLADAVLPLSSMTEMIVRLVRHTDAAPARRAADVRATRSETPAWR